MVSAVGQVIWLPAAVVFMSASAPLAASAARTTVAASAVVRSDVKSMASERRELRARTRL